MLFMKKTIRNRYTIPSFACCGEDVGLDFVLGDVSASMNGASFEAGKSKLRVMHKATQDFLAEKRRWRPQDFLSVLAYGTRATVCCELLNVDTGFEKTMKALDQMAARTRGGTCVKHGLQLVSDRVPSQSPSGGEGNPATRVLAYSDGFDENPEAALKLADDLKSRGVLIETFGVGRSPSDVDETFLKQVASREGEFVHYRFLGDVETLRETFSALAKGTLTFED